MSKVVGLEDAADDIRKLLDAVEHGGESFVIEREGHPVAELVPPHSGVLRARWADVLSLLQTAPQPDPDFARDLEAIRQSAGALPSDPWAPSWTPQP